MLDVLGTASVSSSLTFRTEAGAIQTTAFNTLTLGGDSTGDIILNPSNAAAGGIVRPNSTNVTDLGSSTFQFRNIYGQDIFSNGNLISGLWSQSSGTLFPGNVINDLLIGGTTTASASFPSRESV